ncbi:hypothetical protein [Kocuria sp.]|uniref:hypothetical protein n=1 Tax=Kocuria sp. TaxID=1871328 RepID=UPI0026DAA012|nr:hypothetical protein [Kocuria sp.]MDO4919196.1 hypothetical protein [Kocuria sp.]
MSTVFDPQPHGAERVYVLHGTDSTQVLGPAPLMERVQVLLSAVGVLPAREPSAHPDITDRPFTAESPDPHDHERPTVWSRQRSTVSQVSVELGAERFWDRVHAGSWATWQDRWPDPGQEPLFPPRSPDWLVGAPRWELDPLAPALGPAASGGWVRSPTRGWDDAAGTASPSAAPGPGGEPAPNGVPMPNKDPHPSGETPQHHGVGLFQLTDLESFWILATEEDIPQITQRCEALSAEHPAFTWLTGYFDARDVPGSLRLPAECLPLLEADLTAAGFPVDTWW